MQDRPGFRKTLDIDVAGGMNTRDDSYFLRGRSFDILRNWRRTDSGLRARKGWTKLNTTAVAAVGWWLGGFSYEKSDGTVVELLVGNDSKVYRNVSGTISAVTANDTFSWSATAKVAFAQWRDDCYITVGSTSGCALNIRYDGDADQLFSAGMAAPSGVAVVSGGAGNVTELRYYRVIFVDTVKGYPSAPSDSVSLDMTAEKATITVPVYAGSGRTIHREVHVSSDDTTWKLLELIEDNTTTSSTDNTADLATLGNITAGRTIASTVPVSKYVIGTAGGVLLWGNDVENGQPAWVWRSASADEPEVVDETNVVVGDTGEPITAMRMFGDAAWIGKERSQHLVPLDVTRSHMAVPGIGALSHAGCRNVEGGIVFASHGGIRFFNGQSSPFVGRDPQGGTGSRAFELQRTWDTLAKAALGNVFAVDFGEGGSKHKGVGFFVQTDASVHHSQKCIFWDYRRNELCVDDFFCECAWETNVASSQERRVHGGFPYGFVGRLDYGVGDGAGAEGAASLTNGGVTSATTTSVVTDTTSLTTTGNGHRGVHLHIYDGTASGQFAYVASNDGSTFWLDAGGSHDGGSYTTAPDTTSKWKLGYRVMEVGVPGITATGDLGVAFRAIELQVHQAPTAET